MMRSAEERSIWWSRSESVWAGATTIESPVWTPIGSRFSMLQTVMQVPAASRITSYSISFQPHSDRSTSTWRIGEAARPPWTMRSSSSGVVTNPPPVPPSVYAGRTTSGSPISAANARAVSSDSHTSDGGTGSPISISSCLNASRSSARRITSASAPRNRTPCRARTPAWCSSIARFSPVWPPSVGSTASGRSRSMIRSIASTVSGSM